MQMWSPVQFPRASQSDVLRSQALGIQFVDIGPRLAILRKPVASENQRYVVSWEDWNEEAERRGYDAELQTGPDGSDYAHVRSKPGAWEGRRKEYRDYLRTLGPSRRMRIKLAKPKRRGHR